MTNKLETAEELADYVLERTRNIFLEHYGMAIRDKWNRAALDYHRQVLEHIANIAKKL